MKQYVYTSKCTIVKQARTPIDNHNNNPQFLFPSTEHLITKKLNRSSLLPNYVLCMDFDHFKCKMNDIRLRLISQQILNVDTPGSLILSTCIPSTEFWKKLVFNQSNLNENNILERNEQQFAMNHSTETALLNSFRLNSDSYKLNTNTWYYWI